MLWGYCFEKSEIEKFLKGLEEDCETVFLEMLLCFWINEFWRIPWICFLKILWKYHPFSFCLSFAFLFFFLFLLSFHFLFLFLFFPFPISFPIPHFLFTVPFFLFLFLFFCVLVVCPCVLVVLKLFWLKSSGPTGSPKKGARPFLSLRGVEHILCCGGLGSPLGRCFVWWICLVVTDQPNCLALFSTPDPQ